LKTNKYDRNGFKLRCAFALFDPCLKMGCDCMFKHEQNALVTHHKAILKRYLFIVYIDECFIHTAPCELNQHTFS